MASMFWMRARIEASPRQVKRDAAFGAAGRHRPPNPARIDFAFAVNHINDAFGSDMVRRRVFRYARRVGRSSQDFR
ncbi:MAG: hypothetical protein WBA29_09595 [Xanthobacteraceae bacterium]